MKKMCQNIFLVFLFFTKVIFAQEGSFENVSCVLQVDGKIVTAGQVTVDGIPQFLVVRYLANGLVDTTFNAIGYNTASPTGSQAGAAGVGIDSSNNIIAAGYVCDGDTKVAVQRYTSAGTLDNTFGTGGVFTFSINEGAQANGMAVQADDKILVVGTAVQGGLPYLFVARITTAGILDTTFNTTGIALLPVISHGQSIALDGTDILVAGFTTLNIGFDFIVAKFDTNGSLDTSFDSIGYTITSFGIDAQAYGVAIQSDSKVVVAGRAGTDVALARYLTNGTLDSSYDSDGRVVINTPGQNLVYDLALAADDKAVVSGVINNQCMVLRVTTSGALDTTFNAVGYQVVTNRSTSQGNAVAIQADTKIVSAGWALNDALVIRLNSDGSFDDTFGNEGVVFEPSSGNNGIFDGLVWSFDTTTQNVVTINTLQDVTFDTNVFLDKWSHISGSELFTCNRAGIYLVIYTLQSDINTSTASIISSRGLLNGTEINGSQASLSFGALSNQTMQLSRVFVVKCNDGDELKIQFAGSNIANRLLSGQGAGSFSKPSASITIQRVQG